ncbi:RluA family pseudouridine synthase [Thiocapsa imhoffii]|uniref:Pseudouridine synthase n=1 Tax=Thiocapsa imhoffii TaxID=382777 RepID=A0A9X0WG83_9GAMM|nr:RluA family pseudouridine synthase [Thiocapsa imhoffii]MBK1643993.1 RluA family pseudouridine synthase [Thiocapsa imhoffii]
MTPAPDRRAAQSASSDAGVRILRVDAEANGQRIDNFLLRHLKGVPRSHLYRVLRRGEVRVNKGRIKASHRVQAGDLVRVPPLRAPQVADPGRIPSARLAWLSEAILHEDEQLLVLDKPAGLAVHGGSGLSFGVIESLRALRPGDALELVHRLDRETSGCLMISKRRGTLRQLHALMREGRMDKRYRALMVGDPGRDKMIVDAPLVKNVLHGGERIVRVDHEQGRAARTLFRVQARYVVESMTLTLVEAELVTGRTHQIRVHAASLGTPLAGDPKYGDEEANRRLKALGLGRLFLHAAGLGWTLGDPPRSYRLSAPLPAELAVFLTRLEPST